MQAFKIILALLLLGCLLPMPYSYFIAVRFIAFVGFIILASDADKQRNPNLMWFFIALALLFQPFFKVALGRTLWNIIDVIVAIILFFNLNKK